MIADVVRACTARSGASYLRASVAMLILIGLAVAGSAGGLDDRAMAGSAATRRRPRLSIVVLPFANLRQ